MFERFTESARRVLFFARYELSTLGGSTIEPEHILLGLLHESTEQIGGILANWNVSVQDLRQQVEAHVSGGDRIAASVEAPFSESVRRVLTFAAEEADRILDPWIEPQYLLLGLIREGDSAATTLLTKYGITLEGAREYIVHPRIQDSRSEEITAPSGNAATAAREFRSIHIQRIMALVRDLEQAERNSTRAHTLVERIHDELIVLGDSWT